MSKLIAKLIFGIIKLIFRDKTDLVLENLALRHQLSVLKRKKKPKLKNPDRIFWAWLSRIWPSWKSPLILIKPETVIKWHRKGFKLYWRWKCRHKVGILINNNLSCVGKYWRAFRFETIVLQAKNNKT